MPATLRLMSWNMNNYGATNHAKYDLGPIIARVMQINQVDICAMIEIKHNGHIPIRNSIVAELDNLNYHQHNWKHVFINVGDEGVVYVWHEEALGPNAFVGKLYANSLRVISGKVLKNAANNTIYFPKTKTTWNSLPIATSGRRPAYCAFETNDGAANRQFTFLDMHAPYDKKNTIQSYSTHLYASSREIVRIETVDPVAALTQARPNALLAVNAAVAAAFPAPPMPLPDFTACLLKIQDSIIADLASGMTNQIAFRGAADTGMLSAIKEFANAGFITTAIMGANATEVARSVALVGGIGATFLMASLRLPNHMLAAVVNVAAAVTIVENEINANVGLGHPKKKGKNKLFLCH